MYFYLLGSESTQQMVMVCFQLTLGGCILWPFSTIYWWSQGKPISQFSDMQQIAKDMRTTLSKTQFMIVVILLLPSFGIDPDPTIVNQRETRVSRDVELHLWFQIAI